MRYLLELAEAKEDILALLKNWIIDHSPRFVPLRTDKCSGNLEMSPFVCIETTLLKGQISQGLGHELRGANNHERKGIKTNISYRENN